MDLHNIGALAFLAPFALFFKQARDFAKYLISLFWKTREIPYDYDRIAYLSLRENSYSYNFDNYKIDSTTFFSKKHCKFWSVLSKLNTRELILYKKRVPIFVGGSNVLGIRISYLRFTFNFEKFINAVTEKYIEEKRSEKSNWFYLEEFSGSNKNKRSSNEPTTQGQLVESSPSSPSKKSAEPLMSAHRLLGTPYFNPFYFNRLDLSNSSSDTEKSKYIFTEKGLEILNSVKKWISLEDWYQSHNISYRRGVALYGAPGTGKSSLVLEVAKDCEIPLFVFNLSTMDNWELNVHLKNLGSAKAILLFEDIDLIFEGRKSLLNTEHCSGVTFDNFINKLSGVNSIFNKFVFITTNRIEFLDKALIRPGRCDEVIELPSVNIEEKKRMAEIIIEDSNLVDKAIEKGYNYSTAEFENLCVQISTNNMWENESNKLK